jgi:hypothetical protein
MCNAITVLFWRITGSSHSPKPPESVGHKLLQDLWAMCVRDKRGTLGDLGRFRSKLLCWRFWSGKSLLYIQIFQSTLLHLRLVMSQSVVMCAWRRNDLDVADHHFHSKSSVVSGREREFHVGRCTCTHLLFLCMWSSWCEDWRDPGPSDMVQNYYIRTRDT